MTINKSLGALLILISILMITMSFGHQYVEELSAASSLTVEQSKFEVTPGSRVVINFDMYSSWGTMPWNFNLDQMGDEQLDLWTPKVTIAYGETYHGSFTFNAPTTEGVRSYRLKPYFYRGGSQVGNPYEMIYITVAEPQPVTYDLTVKTLDTNSEQLPGVEVSINTGVIGTSDSTGTVTKPELLGSFTVTGTKEGYTSDSTSVSMTADRTVTLRLASTAEPIVDDTPDETPTPDDTPTEVPTSPTGEPLPTTPPPSLDDDYVPPPTPVPTPVTYRFTVEMLDSSDPPAPIEDVKVMINGKPYYSDISGKVMHISSPGDTLDVVITKEGYNTFQKSYTITSDTLIKVTLPASGGDFFLDFSLADDNPFYDPHGLFGVLPVWVAAISGLLLIAGIYLLRKTE